MRTWKKENKLNGNGPENSESWREKGGFKRLLSTCGYGPRRENRSCDGSAENRRKQYWGGRSEQVYLARQGATAISSSTIGKWGGAGEGSAIALDRLVALFLVGKSGGRGMTKDKEGNSN